MSTNKTEHYGLHSWEGDDDFLRSEMNENFGKLDSMVSGEIQALDAKVVENVQRIDTTAGQHYQTLNTAITQKTGQLNTTINQKVQALNTAIAAKLDASAGAQMNTAIAAKCELKIGTYQGSTPWNQNGYQDIHLGRRPKAVFVWAMGRTGYQNEYLPCFTMNIDGVTSNGMSMTDTGFRVHHDYSSNSALYPDLNKQDKSYMYLALFG